MPGTIYTALHRISVILPITPEFRRRVGSLLRRILSVSEEEAERQIVLGLVKAALDGSDAAWQAQLARELRRFGPADLAEKLHAKQGNVRSRGETLMAMRLSKAAERDLRRLGHFYLAERAAYGRDFERLLDHARDVMKIGPREHRLTQAAGEMALEALRRLDRWDEWEIQQRENFRNRPFSPHALIEKAKMLFETDRAAAVNLIEKAGIPRGVRNSAGQSLYLHHLIENAEYDTAEEIARQLIDRAPPARTYKAFLSNIMVLRDGDPIGLERYLRDLEVDAEVSEPAFDAIRFAKRPKSSATNGVKASIVMTAYNASDYIERSVKSILAQTHENFELLVVDDNSTDDTPAILKQLADGDARLKILKTPSNSGTYVAKNLGIRQVEGAYILLCDSDDIWTPDHLATHIEVMEKDRRLMLTNSLWIRVTNDGLIDVARTGFVIEPCPHSTCFRREVVDKVGVFDAVRFGADREFVSRVQMAYDGEQILKIDRVLTIGRRHESSLTTSGAGAISADNKSHLRVKYWQSWNDWHYKALRAGEQPTLSGTPDDRPFDVPPEMKP